MARETAGGRAFQKGAPARRLSVGGRVKITVPRFRPPRLSAPRGAHLFMAACVVLGGAETRAQTAPAYTDPLAPSLQTDPRNPPRFQTFTRPALARLGPPARFTPAVSGAGDTGFDSSNTRASGTQAPASRMVTTPARAAPAQRPAIQAQLAEAGMQSPQAEQTVSPYQVPPPPLSDGGRAAYGAAPGTPPVELGPTRRPLKKRKAHTEIEDPYAPLGLHAGSFTLFPAIELIGGYDTNPSRTANGGGARLYTIAPELQAQSNWSRHELKADLRGSYTGYNPDETPTLSRPNFDGKVDGRVDVSKQTRVNLGGRVLVSTDNPGSPNLQAGLAKLPIFMTYGGSAGIAHQFNRVELAIKGSAERTIYQDSTLTDGSTSSNEDRQYDQYGGALRGSYELFPGVKPFVEIGADARVHDLATDTSGYQRDSKGVTALVGSTFELARRFTGEFGIGYTQRRYEDPRLENISGLVGDASLIWKATALTTMKLTGKSSVGESTVPGVSGALYRDLGLQVDHAFRRWLIGSLKVGFGLDNYVGMSREDRRYSVGAGLTYKLSRWAQIKGDFRQEWLRSNVSGDDYMASIFLLGVRFQP
jgi:hypothetical protein